MSQVTNPILKGFNPDPSICRVGDDYYIATSTFEWFPGVQIHHSKDLVNWELIAHPLSRVNQLDMKGTPSSTGVWAPCLTYNDGVFYLIYSNTKNLTVTKDSPNYLVTTNDIRGEWSDPIYMNCSGFDPSLFHDADGKKWFVNLRWSHRPGLTPFAMIVLQEYDHKQKKLVGPVYDIFKGSSIGLTEGPHIYQLNGYYYLMVAEGGTSYDHAVSLARSKAITGPYEVHPHNPVLTAKGTDKTSVLQKAGHASICDTPNGDWIMVHLCSRPYEETHRCVLGRETAIQMVEWRDDDWLYMKSGGNTPETLVSLPDLPIQEAKTVPTHYDFDSDQLDIHLNTLRIPASDRILSLTARPGFLRLYGRESLESTFEQSMVARRQQAFSYDASTCLEFEPFSPNHGAGLICFYNNANYYYLRVSHDLMLGGKILGVYASQNHDTTASMNYMDNICIEGAERIYLKVEVRKAQLQFFYSLDDKDYHKIGDILDASTLSDDYAYELNHSFTGAFVGLCCQDLEFSGHHADFDYFSYIEQN